MRRITGVNRKKNLNIKKHFLFSLLYHEKKIKSEKKNITQHVLCFIFFLK